MEKTHSGSSVTKCKIIATGIALPSTCVTSAELDSRFGKAVGYVEKRCGIVHRYHASLHDSQAGLAAQALQLAQVGAHFIPLDLTQARQNDCIRLMTGCHAVWHCAAESSPWGKQAEFFLANVLATRVLAQAAGHAQIPRFIHISTPAVYFDFQHHYVLPESYRARAFSSHYANSKFQAEQEISGAVTRFPATTFVLLRPRGLFGPHDNTIVPRILQQLQRGGGVLRLPRGGDLHTVMVMQPILSGDPALESVLASTVGQLRGAAFLWLIDDDDDDAEAARVTQRLQVRYPQQHITVLSFPQAPEGVNPKLFKLEQARVQVTRDVILVLDDDAVLSVESLCNMLDALTESTLVIALPWYRAADNLPSRLLAQFVNDNSALTYLPLLPFSPPLTLNGMCYAIHGKTLASVGGFAPVLRHLTDDLAMAKLLTRHGVRIVQSAAAVRVQTSVADAKRYFRQMHRWFLFATLLMHEKSAAINLAIFLLQGLHPLLLWALVILAFGGATQTALLLGVLAIHHLALRYVQRAVAVEIPSHPLLSLLSELLQPFHLLNALVNRTIYWRSRRYRIFSNDWFTSL